MPRSISRTLLALALILSSCRSARVEPTLLSESAVVLDIPLVRQDDLYNCGLAAISALCQYWDVSIPPEQREILTQKAKDEKGLAGSELRDALQKDGMEVYLFRGTLDRAETGIYRHLDAGRPLLVMLSPDGKGHHYCLLLGYDEPRRNLVLLDPARGEVLRSVPVFERAWEDCQCFTLLAAPKHASPKNPDGALPTGRTEDYRSQAPSKEN
jgi:ABC-type bacteriocin/lantibiotic exporter with double-glycine peptidase domain